MTVILEIITTAPEFPIIRGDLIRLDREGIIFFQIAHPGLYVVCHDFFDRCDGFSLLYV